MLEKYFYRFTVAYFLLTYSCRYQKSVFLNYMSDFYFQNPLFLKGMSFTVPFSLFLLSGIAVLFFHQKKILKYVFFAAAFYFLMRWNSIYQSFKVDYMPIIFLFLATLYDEKFESDESVTRNKIILESGKALWVVLYFAAGLYKLYHSLEDWLVIGTVKSYIIYQNQFNAYFLPGQRELISWLLQRKELLWYSLMGALLFEVSYPLVYFRKLRGFYLVGTFLFHGMIYLLLDIPFIYHLFGVLFWYLNPNTKSVQNKEAEQFGPFPLIS